MWEAPNHRRTTVEPPSNHRFRPGVASDRAAYLTPIFVFIVLQVRDVDGSERRKTPVCRLDASRLRPSTGWRRRQGAVAGGGGGGGGCGAADGDWAPRCDFAPRTRIPGELGG